MKDPDTNNNIIRGRKDANNIPSGQTQMTVHSCKYSDPMVKVRGRERGSSDPHKIIIMQNEKDNKNKDMSSRAGPYQSADKDNSTIRDKKAWKLMWTRGHWKDCWTYTRIATCISAITLLLYDK